MRTSWQWSLLQSRHLVHLHEPAPSVTVICCSCIYPAVTLPKDHTGSSWWPARNTCNITTKSSVWTQLEPFLAFPNNVTVRYGVFQRVNRKRLLPIFLEKLEETGFLLQGKALQAKAGSVVLDTEDGVSRPPQHDPGEPWKTSLGAIPSRADHLVQALSFRWGQAEASLMWMWHSQLLLQRAVRPLLTLSLYFK